MALLERLARRKADRGRREIVGQIRNRRIPGTFNDRQRPFAFNGKDLICLRSDESLLARIPFAIRPETWFYRQTSSRLIATLPFRPQSRLLTALKPVNTCQPKSSIFSLIDWPDDNTLPRGD
jgi:hypothetical protein